MYAWFDSSGTALYVGRGSGVRPYKHEDKAWWNLKSLLITMTCEDEWESMEYEGKWGKKLQPLYNIEGYRRKN